MTGLFQDPVGGVLVVLFQPNLPLADMKARLILNRLSAKARILSTEPPVEQLDDVDPLTQFSLHLVSESDAAELCSLADVEGVAEVRLEPPPAAGRVVFETKVKGKSALAAKPESVKLGPDTCTTPAAPLAPQLTEPDVIVATVEHEPALAAATSTRGVSKSNGKLSGAKPSTGPQKAKIAETIRVESDRLDHLMNLAGELVITKARFIAIAP